MNARTFTTASVALIAAFAVTVPAAGPAFAEDEPTPAPSSSSSDTPTGDTTEPAPSGETTAPTPESPSPSPSPSTGTTLPIRTVAVRSVQYPKLLDHPGAEHDAIRFTKVQNAEWRLDGTPVTFDGKETTVDKTVTGAAKVTLVGGPASARNSYVIAPGVPTLFTFGKPSAESENSKIPAVSELVTWNDMPKDRDTVTIKKHPGVIWKVTTGTRPAVSYDADAFGKRDSLTVSAKGTTIVAEAEKGWTPTDMTVPASTVTPDPVVTVPAAAIAGAVAVGDNPLDGLKGYGPGSSLESVKITGITGVAWQVGSNPRRVTVKPGATVYVPVPGIEGDVSTVDVKPVALPGYTLADPSPVEVTFDDKAVKPITVTDDMVAFNENAGTTDTVALTAKKGMVWWIGQENTTSAGTTVAYRPARPDRNGKIIYKPRFARNASEAKVYLKPVPNRGYMLDTTTWTAAKKEFIFESATRTLSSVYLVEKGAGTITLSPQTGVTGWTVRYVTKVGVKPVTANTTLKAVDLESRHIQSAVFSGATDPVVRAQLARGYTTTD